jgi:hypothetical protein
MLMRGRSLLQPLESAAAWFLLKAHLALLAAAFLVGFLTVGDFGESWDEQLYIQYGEYGVGAYRYAFQGQLPPPLDAFMEQYGPAYVMLGSALSSLMSAMGAPWQSLTTWHALYFLTFLVCIELMYQFSRRWLSTAASFGVMLLFASQPLLWGHAFINLKDIPFMTLFLASVYTGFAAVDRFPSSRFRAITVLAAAAILGVTVSTRAAGPLAGVLVAIYAGIRLQKKSIPLLTSYVALAAGVTYATWPYLWPAPLERLVQSLQTMSSFPFLVRTQFMGAFYAATELPWFYVPVILGIQLTEPTVVLTLAGLILTIWLVLRRKARAASAGAVLSLFIAWTLLPVVAILGSGGGLYDNARQLFFLLPPLFLLVGIALEALERLVPSRVLMLLCLGLLALPGVWSSFRLHPYEYVYYNGLVGGTGGAYGRYEMDYWATSYAEVRDWLNDHAPSDSKIWIPGGPTYLIAKGLRPDLELSCVAETDCGVPYDYYAALARWRAERRCRGAETVHTVGRFGAVFSVVKQLPDGRACR